VADADADVQPDDAAAADVPATMQKRAPRIHVPTADLDEPTKPTRSRAKAAAVETAVTADIEVDADPVALDSENVDPETGEPKPKKKTRRGSRGGRNRKRKPTTVDAAGENGAEPAAETPVEAEAEVARVPDANGRPDEQGSDDYVPMSEWLDDIEAGDRR
jgi:hypothetical protein